MDMPSIAIKSTHEILMAMMEKVHETTQHYLELEKQAIKEGAFKKALQNSVESEQNTDKEVFNTEPDRDVLSTKPDDSKNNAPLFRPSFFGYRFSAQGNSGIPNLKVTSKDF